MYESDKDKAVKSLEHIRHSHFSVDDKEIPVADFSDDLGKRKWFRITVEKF